MKLEIVLSQKFMHPQLGGEKIIEERFTDFQLAEKEYIQWSENDKFGYQITTIRIVEIKDEKP